MTLKKRNESKTKKAWNKLNRDVIKIRSAYITLCSVLEESPISYLVDENPDLRTIQWFSEE